MTISIPPPLPPVILPPVVGPPALTGAFSRDIDFSSFKSSSAEEVKTQDRIKSVRITRGEQELVRGVVEVAQWGNANRMMNGIWRNMETWKTPMSGNFGQLLGGGIDAAHAQDQIAIESRVDTGPNPIGLNMTAEKLKGIKVGDVLEKVLEDGRVVRQKAIFAGITDPTGFINPEADQTMFYTCVDESSFDNNNRFVVIFETEITRVASEDVAPAVLRGESKIEAGEIHLKDISNIQGASSVENSDGSSNSLPTIALGFVLSAITLEAMRVNRLAQRQSRVAAEPPRPEPMGNVPPRKRLNTIEELYSAQSRWKMEAA
ncbi:MAG: hypothetical protein WD988_00280 [Candidatus Curtissbacteria bacterium]